MWAFRQLRQAVTEALIKELGREKHRMPSLVGALGAQERNHLTEHLRIHHGDPRAQTRQVRTTPVRRARLVHTKRTHETTKST